MKELPVVGLVEEITIIGKEKVKTLALFDTGARTTSVDVKLAAKVRLGPVIKTARVKAASLKRYIKRPVVSAKIGISGKVFETEVNLQDRSHMTFPVIVGRNVLSGHFLVDCKKNEDIFKRMSRKVREEEENGSE
jgi:hypothetical protein